MKTAKRIALDTYTETMFSRLEGMSPSLCSDTFNPSLLQSEQVVLYISSSSYPTINPLQYTFIFLPPVSLQTIFFATAPTLSIAFILFGINRFLSGGVLRPNNGRCLCVQSVRYQSATHCEAREKMREFTTVTGNPTAFNKAFQGWSARKMGKGYGQPEEKKRARAEGVCDLRKTSTVYAPNSQ